MDRLSARIALLMICVMIFANCQNDPKPSSKDLNEDLPLFSLLSPLESGVNFSNILEEDVRRNVYAYLYYYNGSGVAVGDLNNDGLQDIFFTGNNAKNRLFQFDLNCGTALVFSADPVSNGANQLFFPLLTVPFIFLSLASAFFFQTNLSPAF